MKIDDMIRDACAELRTATENRPMPAARFAQAPPRRKRRVWQIALAAVVALSVAALVVRAMDTDGKSQKVDTIAPPSTTAPIDSEPPPSLLPPPANLPYYVGVPLSKLPENLERWGVETDVVLEPGVQDPSRGRIIDQQPGGGTPLTAGMKLTFRVGAPTALLDGEHEIGSGSTGPRGAWRVAASTKVHTLDAGKPAYTLVFLAEQSTTIAGGSPFDSNAITPYGLAQLGLVAGTAPTSAVAVLLLDPTGNTVGSVSTSRADDPQLAIVSFWLIETAKDPAYTTLRAVDRDGNVVAKYPDR